MDSLDFERGMDGLAENDLVDEAEVDSVIRETVLHTIGETAFAQAKVNSWSGQIVEGCLKKLAGMGKPFKYVITCSITQRAGAGLHAASCTRWNPKTDGKLGVHWESETVLALVAVYWAAI
ncbi:hypothetical protein N2152v2_000041 [Parachlorella kessleri]